MTTTIAPMEVLDVTYEKLPPLVHLPQRDRRDVAICGTKIKPDGAGVAGEKCLVCLDLAMTTRDFTSR